MRDEEKPPIGDPPMDDAELRTQLELHHEAAFGWALGCSAADPDSARDTLHNAYRKILDGRARFKGGSSFKTWLFAVIRNTSAEERRLRWLRHLRLGGYAKEHQDAVQTPDRGRTMEKDESTAALRHALARLPRRQQEILYLVFYHELTIEASACVMGVSLGSARTHYDRGKKQLGKLLNPSDHFHGR